MLKRLRVYSLSILALCFCEQASAQVVFRDTTQTVTRSETKFSIGFAFGYSAPEDLNSHIRQELSAWAISGSSDLHLYVAADAGLWIPISKRFSAGPLLEGAVASKTLHDVSANMQAKVYSLWRFSPGIAVQYTFPMHNSYWYISPALQYHTLKYNSIVGSDLRAKAAGFRLEAGVASMLWSLDVRYRCIATLMNSGNANQEGPGLNFSGIAFGIGISIP